MRTARPGVVNGDLAAWNGSVAFIHRFGALISRAADAVSMPVCETSLMRDSDWRPTYGAALERLRQFDPAHLGRCKAVFRPQSSTFGDCRLWPDCAISPCDREGRLSKVLLTFVSGISAAANVR